MKRERVDEIVTQNIGMLRSGLHRKVFLLTVVGLVVAFSIFFLGWSHHHEGSLLRALITSVTYLAFWLAVVAAIRIHVSSIIDMKELIQFQEGRIDGHKVSIARQEKTIQEMEARLREIEPEKGGSGDSGEQDYRKLSGLS
ncbi:MAG: hypothetical protein J6S40_05260 [Thermoguttaceae bacterium]|nr:hypothetical protein [Thermoguttaceae bacterium]